MTFEEYNHAMSIYNDRLMSGEDIMEEINDFQYSFMREVLEEYKAKADTEAKKEIYKILDYAVNHSQSGSVVQYIDDKQLASEIMEIIIEEIGDYMLEAPEFYEEGGEYVIDCIFGGYYVPEWDGWYF